MTISEKVREIPEPLSAHEVRMEGGGLRGCSTVPFSHGFTRDTRDLSMTDYGAGDPLNRVDQTRILQVLRRFRFVERAFGVFRTSVAP